MLTYRGGSVNVCTRIKNGDIDKMRTRVFVASLSRLLIDLSNKHISPTFKCSRCFGTPFLLNICKTSSVIILPMCSWGSSISLNSSIDGSVWRLLVLFKFCIIAFQLSPSSLVVLRIACWLMFSVVNPFG